MERGGAKLLREKVGGVVGAEGSESQRFSSSFNFILFNFFNLFTYIYIFFFFCLMHVGIFTLQIIRTLSGCILMVIGRLDCYLVSWPSTPGASLEQCYLQCCLICFNQYTTLKVYDLVSSSLSSSQAIIYNPLYMLRH